MENNTVNVMTEDFETIEEKVGFGTKLKNGFKKHGKKIVAGAAVAVTGLAAYALGAKFGAGDHDQDGFDVEYFDMTDSESNTEE